MCQKMCQQLTCRSPTSDDQIRSGYSVASRLSLQREDLRLRTESIYIIKMCRRLRRRPNRDAGGLPSMCAHSRGRSHDRIPLRSSQSHPSLLPSRQWSVLLRRRHAVTQPALLVMRTYPPAPPLRGSFAGPLCDQITGYSRRRTVASSGRKASLYPKNSFLVRHRR